MPKKLKFKKKTNKFIETGSYMGDGIQLAMDSGFDDIFSIEVSNKYFKICEERFIGNKNVKMILGDSMYELSKLLDNYRNDRFTYWLDGHYSDGDTGRGSKDFPIMIELESILKRNVNGEVIYIDDMRILKNLDEEVNLDSIISLVGKYKNYEITYEDSILHTGEYLHNDIMVIEY